MPRDAERAEHDIDSMLAGLRQRLQTLKIDTPALGTVWELFDTVRRKGRIETLGYKANLKLNNTQVMIDTQKHSLFLHRFLPILLDRGAVKQQMSVFDLHEQSPRVNTVMVTELLYEYHMSNAQPCNMAVLRADVTFADGTTNKRMAVKFREYNPRVPRDEDLATIEAKKIMELHAHPAIANLYATYHFLCWFHSSTLGTWQGVGMERLRSLANFQEFMPHTGTVFKILRSLHMLGAMHGDSHRGNFMVRMVPGDGGAEPQKKRIVLVDLDNFAMLSHTIPRDAVTGKILQDYYEQYGPMSQSMSATDPEDPTTVSFNTKLMFISDYNKLFYSNNELLPFKFHEDLKDQDLRPEVIDRIIAERTQKYDSFFRYQFMENDRLDKHSLLFPHFYFANVLHPDDLQKVRDIMSFENNFVHYVHSLSLKDIDNFYDKLFASAELFQLACTNVSAKYHAWEMSNAEAQVPSKRGPQGMSTIWDVQSYSARQARKVDMVKQQFRISLSDDCAGALESTGLGRDVTSCIQNTRTAYLWQAEAMQLHGVIGGIELANIIQTPHHSSSDQFWTTGLTAQSLLLYSTVLRKIQATLQLDEDKPLRAMVKIMRMVDPDKPDQTTHMQVELQNYLTAHSNEKIAGLFPPVLAAFTVNDKGTWVEERQKHTFVQNPEYNQKFVSLEAIVLPVLRPVQKSEWESDMLHQATDVLNKLHRSGFMHGNPTCANFMKHYDPSAHAGRQTTGKRKQSQQPETKLRLVDLSKFKPFPIEKFSDHEEVFFRLLEEGHDTPQDFQARYWNEGNTDYLNRYTMMMYMAIKDFQRLLWVDNPCLDVPELCSRFSDDPKTFFSDWYAWHFNKQATLNKHDAFFGPELPDQDAAAHCTIEEWKTFVAKPSNIPFFNYLLNINLRLITGTYNTLLLNMEKFKSNIRVSMRQFKGQGAPEAQQDEGPAAGGARKRIRPGSADDDI